MVRGLGLGLGLGLGSGLGLAEPNLARSPGALALYGAGDVPEAMSRMELVFRSKGVPASNNPDDIPLLQELSTWVRVRVRVRVRP